jgi:hypothetical protein
MRQEQSSAYNSGFSYSLLLIYNNYINNVGIIYIYNLMPFLRFKQMHAN